MGPVARDSPCINVIMWYMTPGVLKKKEERLLPFYGPCELGFARGVVEMNRHAVDGRTVTVFW